VRGGDVVHTLVERYNVGKIVVNADDDFIIIILVLSCIMYHVFFCFAR